MTTIYAVALVTALIIVWDIFLYVTQRETISSALAITGHRYPLLKIIIILLIGVLVGHWFWPIYIAI